MFLALSRSVNEIGCPDDVSETKKRIQIPVSNVCQKMLFAPNPMVLQFASLAAGVEDTIV